MSLNKFTSIQKGLDLNLEIGCDEISANIATITTSATIESIEATTINTVNLTVGGESITHTGGTQSEGLSFKTIENTTDEGSLFPSVYLGSQFGAFPADTLKIGDVVKIESYFRVRGTAGSLLNVRLYLGNGVSSISANTGLMDMSGSLLFDLGKIEISVLVRDALVCHIDGTFTVFDSTTKASKTYVFTQLQNLLDIAVSNTFKLNAEWNIANINNSITSRTYNVSKKSVNEL